METVRSCTAEISSTFGPYAGMQGFWGGVGAVIFSVTHSRSQFAHLFPVAWGFALFFAVVWQIHWLVNGRKAARAAGSQDSRKLIENSMLRWPWRLFPLLFIFAWGLLFVVLSFSKPEVPGV